MEQRNTYRTEKTPFSTVLYLILRVNGTVPILINFCFVEIGAVQVTLIEKIKTWAALRTHKIN